MIAGLYRREAGGPSIVASTVVSPACDPVDPLEGARPTWRLGDAGEPEWLAVVALLGDPTAVRVDVVDVQVVTPVQVVEVPDGPPTRALRLVEAVEVVDGTVEDDDEACPDCGATGYADCRPKSNPAGRPLTRWHRRRRLLAQRDHADARRDTGRGEVLLLALVAALVLAVAAGAGSWLAGAVDHLTPCVSSTASGLGATDCPTPTERTP